MAATIVIDDSVNPASIGSTDNPNSFLGNVHTLSNFDNSGVLGWRWTLVDKPIGSSATLSATTTATTQITPDIAGNYLVRLETFVDAARSTLDAADEQVIGVRFEEPFDWMIPAAGETTQQNAARGWAESREEAIRHVHGFMNSGIPQLIGAINAEVDGADPETVLGGFVLDPRGLPTLALQFRVIGALTVAGGGDGELRLYDMGAVGAAAAAGVLRSTVTIENAAAGGVVVRDQALTAAASPGVGADEVITARHRYELRAELVGGAGGDTFKIHNGGITLES